MNSPSSNLLGRRGPEAVVSEGGGSVLGFWQSTGGFERKKLKTLSREISFQFAWPSRRPPLFFVVFLCIYK